MTVRFMPSAQCGSWGEFELLGAPRRIGLPAAAGRAAPVELARLEAAGLATIAREALRVPVHQAPHQLEVAPALGRGADQLDFDQAVEAEQRRIAAQLVAHQAIGLLGSLGLEGLLEDDVEQVERRIALEVAL